MRSAQPVLSGPLAAIDMGSNSFRLEIGQLQHGRYRRIDYLKETVRLGGGLDADGDWSPQINLGVPVLIPDTYIPDLDVRLGLYRRLSSLSTKVEMEGFAAELIDRFGELPREVNTLLNVIRIKAMCRKAGIARLDVGPKGATVQFHRDKFANPAGLVEFIQAEKGAARVKDNKIILTRAFANDAEKVKGAFQIARDMAEKAIAATAKMRKPA